MEEIRDSGTWGSSLSADEFAAIRSTGFEPVGQVLGAAVYNIGYTGGYACPGAWAGYGGFVTPAARRDLGLGRDARWARSGRWWPTLYEARRKAIGRMEEECQELGGHGIVGRPADHRRASRRAAWSSRPSGRPCARQASAPPREPFTSDLSGQDFAKLILAGLGAGRAWCWASRSGPGTTTG